MGNPALKDDSPRRLTVEEYLALEAESETKHEFWDGYMIPVHGRSPAPEFKAMAGATKAHVALANRVATALTNRLAERPCEVASSDLRVQLHESSDYVYPDVVLYCEAAQWLETQPDTLLTPLVLVEVLSPSTAERDRNAKLENYQRLPSLCDYLIFSPERVSIEHYARGEGDTWIYRHLTQRAQTVRLACLDLEISVAEFYRRLDVPEGLRLLRESPESAA